MTYKRIRELREDHDLTQTYMAHYLNVNQRTYSRYERGERSVPLEQLCRIADFYKVSVDYLLGLDYYSCLCATGLTVEQIVHIQQIISDILS